MYSIYQNPRHGMPGVVDNLCFVRRHPRESASWRRGSTSLSYILDSLFQGNDR